MLRPSTRPAERALTVLLEELDAMIEACSLVHDALGDGSRKELEERQESLSEEVTELRDRVEEEMESGPMVPVVREDLNYIAENVRRAAEALLSVVSLLIGSYDRLSEEQREKIDRVAEMIAKLASGLREAVQKLEEDVEEAAKRAEEVREEEEKVRTELRSLLSEEGMGGDVAPLVLEIERALTDMDRALDGVSRIKVRFLG
ncbi:MAG: DUF47 family protein [Euryarchaeota archaeon]